MSRILVVEDELHLAEGLRFNLEAEGYQVDVVDTGEAALDLLLPGDHRFDVVVLDIMLPGKDGFTVMRELRHAGQFVPTLMLTARGHADDILQGVRGGCGRLSDQAVRTEYSDCADSRTAAAAGLADEIAGAAAGGGDGAER